MAAQGEQRDIYIYYADRDSAQSMELCMCVTWLNYTPAAIWYNPRTDDWTLRIYGV